MPEHAPAVRSKLYNRSYYTFLTNSSKRSAELTVPILIALVQPHSVVDIGCGVGTWLTTFRDLGIDDYLGIDGDFVDADQLLIPVDCFQRANLAQPLNVKVGRKFDLAICLEVAEHLPEQSASDLVRLLTELSPVVFFSAAIPNQGGANHINEQWPDYWRDLFSEHEYLLIDAVRAQLWDKAEVEPWYKQNAFLYVHTSMAQQYLDVPEGDSSFRPFPLRVVHPDLYYLYATMGHLSGRRLVKELLRRIQDRLFRKPHT